MRTYPSYDRLVDQLVARCEQHVFFVLKSTLLSFVQDGLLASCAEMMIEKLGNETVCRYYAAAIQYGQQSVEAKCLEWLERRLTSSATVELLRNIR